MSTGSKRGRSSNSKGEDRDEVSRQKRRDTGKGKAGEKEERSKETLSSFCEGVSLSEKLCEQEEHTQKPWYIRDGRLANMDCEIIGPSLWLEVRFPEADVHFGTVIYAMVTEYVYQTKKTKTTRNGLMLICMSGAHGFTSVILDISKYDKKSFKKFQGDPVCAELEKSLRNKETTVDKWIFTFLIQTERDIFPVVEKYYRTLTGEKISFKSSVKKLNVKHPREDKSRDSESIPSEPGKETETAEQTKKSTKEPRKKKVTAKEKASKKPLELAVQKVCLPHFIFNL
jgi:hypothetical protein